MLKCFKNEKLWCVVGGAVAMVIGKTPQFFILKAFQHCKEDPSAGCFRSGKGHEAAE